MMVRRSLLPFVFILLFFNSVMLFGREPVKIRVAVLRDKAEVTLAVTGTFDIIDARRKTPLYRGRHLAASKVTSLADGLKIRAMTFRTNAVMLVARRKAGITVNGRPYRGEISIFRDQAGRLTVVNAIDMESYVKGVLYHEISHKWPIDAIKAQAVAVRTYAMYQKQVMQAKDYDLTADTSSQVYGGYASEKRKTNRAANFTHGEILSYKGKVFPAYFHATCAGITEDASQLWKIDLAPLKGGRVCKFCRDSPHYFWKATIDLKAIRKKLGDRYRAKRDLRNIAVTERTATGRVKTLELSDAAGETLGISAKDFRALVGPDLVRSTNFSMGLDGDRVTFSGKGWGHGAGLCQWGALGMSRKGHNYKQILEFYYPGAEIARIQ